VSTIKDFDINELVLQLHNELQFAFGIAQSGNRAAHLRIDEVKARLGRNQIKVNEELDDRTNNFLNPERYPDEEDWEIEVSYKFGDLKNGYLEETKWDKPGNHLLIIHRLGKLPVIDLKGINRGWNNFFKNAGILTFEQLAFYDSDKMIELCKLSNSLLPLQFQTQLLMLIRDFRPLKFPDFKTIPLSVFLLKTNAALKMELHGKLTGPEISDLKNLASIIFLIVDKKIASKLTLELFLG
jgi:hypothetical protein